MKAKFPNSTFKIRWEPLMDAFLIATNDSILDDSKEYSQFTWQLRDAIFSKCPFLLYFVFDNTLADEDYDKTDYDIPVEKYTFCEPRTTR